MAKNHFVQTGFSEEDWKFLVKTAMERGVSQAEIIRSAVGIFRKQMNKTFIPTGDVGSYPLPQPPYPTNGTMTGLVEVPLVKS